MPVSWPGSRSRTVVPAFRRRWQDGCSSPSTPRRRVASGWACRSRARSWKPIAAGYGSSGAHGSGGPPSGSRCRFTQRRKAERVVMGEHTVFVVDDDKGVRRSLTALGRAHGLAVEAYASGDAFLAAYDPARPGCLILDVRLAAREKEVAGFLVKGKRSKEIAAALGISPRTAEGHRRQVLRKMEVGSTAELATAWFTQQPTTPATPSRSST